MLFFKVHLCLISKNKNMKTFVSGNRFTFMPYRLKGFLNDQKRTTYKFASLCFFICIQLLFPSSKAFAEEFVFETNTIRYVINSNGLNVSLQEKSIGKELIGTVPSPFAFVTYSGKTHPVSQLLHEDDCFVAKFGETGIVAYYRIEAYGTHIIFELKSLKGADPESIRLCDIKTMTFPNTGSIIAAQWNDQITICLMALSERVDSQVRGNNSIFAKVYPQFGMVGEKVALIVVPTSAFLDVVQEVEKTYRLPSPAISGQWAKRSSDIETNYLFIDLSEKTADKIITYAKLGGFKYVLLPWSSWASSRGSYPINTRNFPNGEKSLKDTIDKFHAAGLKVGMHMMTSLVGKNDPLVRPRPDYRLLKDAATVLAEDIDARKMTIAAADDLGAFSDNGRQTGRGADVKNDIQIDNEIIFCGETGSADPRMFSNCKRGAYGTIKKPHKAGTAIYCLAQGAGSYMADLKTSLKEDIADRIATVVNTCGFDMVYFDGGEIDKANGPYWYYVGQQQTAIWKRIKRDVLFQGSGITHWSWHIISRGTCDDYAAIAVRSFMDDHKIYRLKNYRANFMPAELGWCGLLSGGPGHPATTVGDIDHYGARMIAYNAPMSIQTKLKRLERNPRSLDILERLKHIDGFRRSGKITQLQREELKTGNWLAVDNASGVSFQSIKPEKNQSSLKEQTNFVVNHGRVLFQGNMRLISDTTEDKSSLSGRLINRIYFRDHVTTEKDNPWLIAEVSERPVTPQNLSKRKALAVTIQVSHLKKNISPPYPVLNIQLEDDRGRYRDYYIDLDFAGEKTVIIPKTNVERLLPEFGRPKYKFKRAYRSFNYNKVAAVNLRWMRQPENSDMIVFLKKILAVSAQNITTTAAQDDR